MKINDDCVSNTNIVTRKYMLKKIQSKILNSSEYKKIKQDHGGEIHFHELTISDCIEILVDGCLAAIGKSSVEEWNLDQQSLEFDIFVNMFASDFIQQVLKGNIAFYELNYSEHDFLHMNANDQDKCKEILSKLKKCGDSMKFLEKQKQYMNSDTYMNYVSRIQKIITR